MKKFISILISFVMAFQICLFHPRKSYAEFKLSWKLIGGTVLCGVGGFLAYDGFRKVDVSDPRVDTSDWHWTKEQIIDWWVNANGKIKNTGNVPLDDLKVHLYFYDAGASEIAYEWTFLDTYWLDPLPVNKTDTWFWPAVDCGSSEPMSGKIGVTYTYGKKYETHSVGEGVAGIAAIAGGAYLLYSYLTEVGFFSKLEEKGIEVKLVTNPDSIYLLASTRLF